MNKKNKRTRKIKKKGEKATFDYKCIVIVNKG